ncbi:MAG: hypothetical protein FWF58_03300, partial [Firmicutes bacterium]|nr:hypothetical protein [Bacillota bacterium]
KVSFEVDHIVYTATSETIKVDVIDSEDNKTPIIVSQPQSHDNVGIGETVTIEVVAKLPNGDTSTLQYQWYQVVFGSPDGDYMLQDETRASLNVSREVVGDEYYYVVVSNVVGGEVFSTTSEQAKITVVEDEDLDIPNGNGQNGDGLAGESGKFGKSNSSDMLMLITISAGIVLVGFVIVAVVVAKKNKTNRNKYRNIYRG